MAAALCVLVVAPAPSAHSQERWLVSVEAPAALPIGAPQDTLFGIGFLPAVAGYHSFGAHLLTGLRLRAGALSNGIAPSDPSLRDPGLGGLGSLSFALRARPLARATDESRARGLWLELAGGAGLTGTLLRGTVEAGMGWNFHVARVTLGPSLRYLQIVQPSDALESRDAHIALAGIEVGFFDGRPTPVAPVVVAAAEPPPDAPQLKDTDGDGIPDPIDRCPHEPEDRDDFEDQDGCPDPDNDRDGVADALDRCPAESETVNGVDDQDGCADKGLIELIGDRIVLDERVLFDTARARVKTAGRPALQAIVTLWKQHPEWQRMSIEGHADVRGPDRFNDWLSAERALRVRRVLVEMGMPDERIDTKGYGRTRPRDTNRTPEAHQQNRRVEFVIVTGTAPLPPAPVAPAEVAPPAQTSGDQP